MDQIALEPIMTLDENHHVSPNRSAPNPSTNTVRGPYPTIVQHQGSSPTLVVQVMQTCLGGSGGVGEAHSHLSNSVDVQGWWGSGVHWHGLGGGLGMVAHWIGRVTCDLYQFGSRGGSGF